MRFSWRKVRLRGRSPARSLVELVQRWDAAAAAILERDRRRLNAPGRRSSDRREVRRAQRAAYRARPYVGPQENAVRRERGRRRRDALARTALGSLPSALLEKLKEMVS